jgi:hypothetical protein
MQHTPTSTPVSAKPATTRTYPSVLIRKVLRVMSKLFWLIVFWLVAAFGAQMAGLDTSKPAVLIGALVVGTVAAVVLTWGDGNEQES